MKSHRRNLWRLPAQPMVTAEGLLAYKTIPGVATVLTTGEHDDKSAYDALYVLKTNPEITAASFMDAVQEEPPLPIDR